MPLETYTAQSAHEWKIGRKGHDDGAVLFLFMRDHKVRIEVGYGLEGSLTDADSKRIIDDGYRAAHEGRRCRRRGEPRGGGDDQDDHAGVCGRNAAAGAERLAGGRGRCDLDGSDRRNVSFDCDRDDRRAGASQRALRLSGDARGAGQGKGRHEELGGSSGGFIGAMASGGGDDSSSSSDDDFDAGGGDFGGGGASGSW